jgi:DNA replication protein DnaC
MSAVVEVSPELKALLRGVKLGRCLDTLPERLALARTAGMGHAEFLELVLADEVDRRERTSADRRSTAAGLDPTMTLDRWDDTAKVTYDHKTWRELTSLRFVDAGHNALILGPVGVGKTFMATALGHAAVRRRFTVHFERCDRLLKRLRASRLDNSHDTEMRKLIRVDLLIIDDFALQALDAIDTADVYELIVERHRAAATVVTSNREPIKAHRFRRTCARWHLKLTGSPSPAQRAVPRRRDRPGSQRDLRLSCRAPR